MNKEEIDNLESYLKNNLPKIEPTIPIANFGSVDLEDLMSSIKQFKKVPTFDELLRENKKLRSQLEEKDKVINEAIEFIDDYKAYENVYKQVKPHQFVSGFEDILDEEHIDKLLEILERGKNGNS